MDLVDELLRKTRLLTPAIKRHAKAGIQYAEAERNYKIALRQHALILRAEDMAIGMIDKTVYGIPDVANLRFERDVAYSDYRTVQEYINTLKIEIRVLESQIQREWGADIDR